jgi:phosphate transport system permease protein
MSLTVPTAPVDLTGDPRRRRKERAIRSGFLATALASVVISALIVLSLFGKGWEFIAGVEWSSLLAPAWNPRAGEFGIPTILAGSLIVTAIGMVVALPVGLASAVYLSEYARPRTRKVLKPVLEIIAGVPSVVLGYFALVWIAPNVLGQTNGSFAAAGLAVGVLIIPLVASVSEDAMNSVPDALREASAGLGAPKRTTTLKVVLPAALSGLVAAAILAVSRALGETMVVFIAGGAADTSRFTADPLDGGLTMTAAMASLAKGTDQVKGEGLAYPSLFFVGIVLFAFTMGLNLLADRFVRRFRQAY